LIVTTAPGQLKVLLFSSLYPSSARPHHGVFVETRLRELLADSYKLSAMQVKVVAPVPWFFSKHPRWGTWSAPLHAPLREQHHGIDVVHPRYLVLPKIGMSLAAVLMALSVWPTLRKLRAEGFDFDLIDAHYFYPDGVAAALLAWWFNKPLVITARGSDINLISTYWLPRRLMQWAGQRAGALVGVSQALVNRMRALGMPAQRLHMLRNGVDLKRFHPMPTDEARRLLGQQGDPLLLSVGNLVEWKGHHLCIDALAEIRKTQPQARLLIVGEGPERPQLQAQIVALGLQDHVQLVGTVPNAELAPWFSAADVLLLASSREGWPNVLLEAMACGTPVVAASVGGVPEIVGPPATGRVVPERRGTAYAAAVLSVLAAGVDRQAVRGYAEGFGWAPTSQAQSRLFMSLAGSSRCEEGVTDHA
jgi:teichuronic acid biosynthesis glycosyltransferase TuaC